MSELKVEVQGLNELARALKRVDAQARKELGRAIKSSAALVATKAKELAAGQGFAAPGKSGRGTGLLLRSIKPSVRGTVGFVRETARRGEFAYPAIYEFGGPGRVGSRPFLVPAAQASRDKVVRSIDEAVGRLIDSAGLS